MANLIAISNRIESSNQLLFLDHVNHLKLKYLFNFTVGNVNFT